MSQSLFDQPLVLVRMLHADQADVLNKKTEKGSTLYYVHYLQRGCACEHVVRCMHCQECAPPIGLGCMPAHSVLANGYADKADQLPFA